MKAEDSIQIAVADYLRLQYPNLLWFHVANERQTSPRHGAKLKRMGVRAGVADIMILKATKQAVGLCIELKAGKNKQTPSQVEFRDAVIQEGWAYYVCYDFDSARKVIDKYLLIS